MSFFHTGYITDHFQIRTTNDVSYCLISVDKRSGRITDPQTKLELFISTV